MIKFFMLILLFISPKPSPPPLPDVWVPKVCEFIPQDDWVACREPTSWEDLCFSVTNYWPFDENGELVPWEGQANGQPWATANGFPITSTTQAETFVAAPLSYVGLEFCNSWLGCVPIHDTFGHPIYQGGGFWHSTYKQHIVPIDIISPRPIHYLDCTGVIVP